MPRSQRMPPQIASPPKQRALSLFKIVPTEQLKNHVHSWAMDKMGPKLAESKTVCVPAFNFPNALATMPPYPGQNLRKGWNDLK